MYLNFPVAEENFLKKKKTVASYLVVSIVPADALELLLYL